MNGKQDTRDSYDGFSTYETWAYFELLRNLEDSLGYWLAEAEKVRDEVWRAEEDAAEAVANAACRRLLAARLREKHEEAREVIRPESWHAEGLVVWDEIAGALLFEPLPPRRPLFSLGEHVITTPGAYHALTTLDRCVGLVLHNRGVWGELDEEDAEENERALREGGRLFSAYHAKDGTRFYVITEQDRSVTTVLLPEDY